MTDLSKYPFVPLALSADGPVWGRTKDAFIVGDIRNPTLILQSDIRDYRPIVYKDGEFIVESL